MPDNDDDLLVELRRIFREGDDDAMDALVDSRRWPDVCKILGAALAAEGSDG